MPLTPLASLVLGVLLSSAPDAPAAAPASEATPGTKGDYLPAPAPDNASFTDPRIHHDRFGFQKIWEAELPGETIDEWWLDRGSLYAETDRLDRQHLRLWSLDRESGIVKWQVALASAIRNRPVETKPYLFYESENHLYAVAIDKHSRTGREYGLPWLHLPLDWVGSPAPPPRLNGGFLPPSRPPILTGMHYGLIDVSGRMHSKWTGPPREWAAEDSTRIGLRTRDRNFFVSSQIAADYESPVHVFVGGYDDRLYAINVKSLQRDWKYTTGGDIRSEPLVRADKIYFLSEDGRLYLCDERWGERITRPFATENGIAGSMGIDGDILYLASSDFNLYALHRLSLELLTKFRAGVPLLEPPQGITHPEYGTRVYFRTSTGDFYCMKLARGGDRSYPRNDPKATNPDPFDPEGAQLVDQLVYPDKVTLRYRPRFWYQPPGQEGREIVWRLPGALRVIGVGQKRYPDLPRSLYILKEGNVLAAVNDDTGEVRWEYPLKDMSHVLPLVPDPSGVYPPILYMATRDGRAFAFMETYEWEKRRWEKALGDSRRETEEGRRFDEALRRYWTPDGLKRSEVQVMKEQDNLLRRMEKEVRGQQEEYETESWRR